MDKQLLKAYIRTIVEEEVKRVLPEMLSEAVQEIKKINKINESVADAPRPKVDRARLAQMMGLEYDGQTLMATNSGPSVAGMAPGPDGRPIKVDPSVAAAIGRDYSSLMKKMGLT